MIKCSLCNRPAQAAMFWDVGWAGNYCELHMGYMSDLRRPDRIDLFEEEGEKSNA